MFDFVFRGALIIVMAISALGLVLLILNPILTRRANKNFAEILKHLPEFSPSQSVLSTTCSTGLSIDQNNHKLCLWSGSEPGFHISDFKVINYEDILSSELFEDGRSVTSTSRTSQLGGTVVGSVLAGGVGAIIGGLSAKTSTEFLISNIGLRLTTNDLSKPIHTLQFLPSLETDKNDFAYENAIETARHWHGILSAIIKQCDREMSVNMKNDAEPETAALATELERLAGLHASGMLTDEEFIESKRQVLGKSSACTTIKACNNAL